MASTVVGRARGGGEPGAADGGSSGDEEASVFKSALNSETVMASAAMASTVVGRARGGGAEPGAVEGGSSGDEEESVFKSAVPSEQREAAKAGPAVSEGRRCAYRMCVAVVGVALLLAAGGAASLGRARPGRPGKGAQSMSQAQESAGQEGKGAQSMSQAQESAGQEEKPMAPLMDPADRELFKRLLKESTTYFEWGSGGSTAWAVETLSVRKIHTIENSMEWVQTLKERKQVRGAVREGRLTLTAVDLGPVRNFAYPKRKNAFARRKWGGYSDQIFAEPEAHWDLIMVDGRFRVPCALKALQHIKDRSTTRIVIHDYEREAYHQVEEFADLVERAHVLAVFRKKANVDEARLQAKVKATEHDLQRL